MVSGITAAGSPLTLRSPFEEGLTAWVNRAPPSERPARITAYDRILACYENQESKLCLSVLQLTELPPEIGALTNLTTLYLCFNQLKCIPPEIGALTNLTTLDLSHNELERIPPEISALTNLTTLHLFRNKFRDFPSEINALTSLTTLDLSSNKLKAIPPTISVLTNLTTLKLCLNELRFIPPEIGALKKLTTLKLSLNKLKCIPPEIGALTSLTTLTLACNELKCIPPEIGALTSLTTLDLSSNKLERIPPEIGALTNLTTLALPFNELKVIPPEIGALTSLTTLDLSRNDLRAIPNEIGTLFSLTTLYLTTNENLTTVPMILGQLSELTYIAFQGTQVPKNLRTTFSDLQIARRLDVKAATGLPEELKIWKTVAESDSNLSFISNLNVREQATINEWLIRLARTKQFRYHQKELATITCEILAFLNQNREFKTFFITIAKQNNDSCADRAAQSFNLTYTLFKLFSLPSDASFQDKLSIFLRGAKTLTLRNYVDHLIEEQEEKKAQKLMEDNHTLTPQEAQKISKEKEAVEIQLFVESSLRESLTLLSFIEETSYATTIGNRDFISLEEIQNYVEENYLNRLDTVIGFEEFARKVEPNLAQELDAVERNDTYLSTKQNVLKRWAHSHRAFD
jgi:Leucine-rich repeat (LRR) protein